MIIRLSTRNGNTDGQVKYIMPETHAGPSRWTLTLDPHAGPGDISWSSVAGSISECRNTEAWIALFSVSVWVCLIVLIFKRSRRILEGWAEENDFTLVSAEFRFFRKGPFFWRSSKGQTVYYIVIQTSDGETKRGWVRCGRLGFRLMAKHHGSSVG